MQSFESLSLCMCVCTFPLPACIFAGYVGLGFAIFIGRVVKNMLMSLPT